MIEYIYFIKCPSCPECHDEHFYYFDEAKARAMNFLSHKPIITQVEADYNDFHECTDSCDLGTVWSWEDTMKDMPKDNELTTFSKSETLECDDDYFNCEFDDDSLATVPDNFRKPGLTESADYVDNWVYLDYDAKVTKEELYDLLVTQGRCVEIGIGDQEHYYRRFSDGSRYSDSKLVLSVNRDGSFEAYEWDHSDDGDSADGEFELTSDSFDEFWDDLADYAPEYFIESTVRTPAIADSKITESNEKLTLDLLADAEIANRKYDYDPLDQIADEEIANKAKIREGVTDDTRAPRDSDFVIVSKHPNRSTYSFLGNNYRMTRDLNKAMPYSTKEEAEYDIKYAEDLSIANGAYYDRYTSMQFFVATVREAKQLLDDAKWRKTKQLSFADMTIESLVEKMEENEDTVECKVCEELHDKTECHKDHELGWVCKSCSSTIITEDTPGGYQCDYYFECYDYDHYLLEYNNIPIICNWEEVHDGISMYEPNVIEGEDEVTLPCYGFIVSIRTLLSWLKDVAREPSMISYTVDHVSDDFDFDLFEAALEKHKVALFNHFYDDAVEQAQELYDSGDERVVSLVAEATEGLEESLKEAINPMEMVELEYPELTVTLYGPKRAADDWDEVEHTDSYVYLVPKAEVATVIWENWITEEDAEDVLGGLKTLEDDRLWELFLETNFDTLFEKYKSQVLEYFRDEATDDFRERSQEEYSMNNVFGRKIGNYNFDESAQNNEFKKLAKSGPASSDNCNTLDNNIDIIEPEPSEEPSFLDVLEDNDSDNYRDRLQHCPECGGFYTFDPVTGFCINCGFNV